MTEDGASPPLTATPSLSPCVASLGLAVSWLPSAQLDLCPAGVVAMVMEKIKSSSSVEVTRLYIQRPTLPTIKHYFWTRYLMVFSSIC